MAPLHADEWQNRKYLRFIGAPKVLIWIMEAVVCYCGKFCGKIQFRFTFVLNFRKYAHLSLSLVSCFFCQSIRST